MFSSLFLIKAYENVKSDEHCEKLNMTLIKITAFAKVSNSLIYLNSPFKELKGISEVENSSSSIHSTGKLNEF